MGQEDAISDNKKVKAKYWPLVSSQTISQVKCRVVTIFTINIKKKRNSLQSPVLAGQPTISTFLPKKSVSIVRENKKELIAIETDRDLRRPTGSQSHHPVSKRLSRSVPRIRSETYITDRLVISSRLRRLRVSAGSWSFVPVDPAQVPKCQCMPVRIPGRPEWVAAGTDWRPSIHTSKSGWCA